MKLQLAQRDGLADGRSSIIYRLAEDVSTDVRTDTIKKAAVRPIVPPTRVRRTISLPNTHTSIVSTPTTCPCPIKQSTTLSPCPQSPITTPFLSLRHLPRRYFLLSSLAGSVNFTALCTSYLLNSDSRTSGFLVQIRYGFGGFVCWGVGAWDGYLGRLWGVQVFGLRYMG